MTSISQQTDIKPVYKILIEALNKTIYEENLIMDPDLFVDLNEWDSQLKASESSSETGPDDDNRDDIYSEQNLLLTTSSDRSEQ